MNTSDRTTQELLSEILVWIKASSFSNVHRMLEDALPSAKDRQIYQALDGKASQRDLEKLLGVSRKRIGSMANRCVARGLMKKSDQLCERLFDLNDFDMLPQEAEDDAKRANNG